MRLTMLLLVVVCTLVPAAFGAHFGFSVGGATYGHGGENTGGAIFDTIEYFLSAVTFSIDGMPGWLGIYFIFISLTAVVLVITLIAPMGWAGIVLLGLGGFGAALAYAISLVQHGG